MGFWTGESEMKIENIELLPPSLRAGILNYFEHRIIPGSFLEAVLTNDLEKAVSKADRENATNLVHIVLWLIAYAPPRSWGSKEIYYAWIHGPKEI